jgi:lipopolysaccharide transport system permease protein
MILKRIAIGALMMSLWSYRGFILGSVKREFQSKYQNSLLGAAWTVIQPLACFFKRTLITKKAVQEHFKMIESLIGACA